MPELGTGTPGSSLGHVIPLFLSKETLLYMFSPHPDVKIGTNKILRGWQCDGPLFCQGGD